MALLRKVSRSSIIGARKITWKRQHLRSHRGRSLLRRVWRSYTIISTVLAVPTGRGCIAVGSRMHNRGLLLVGWILRHTSWTWRLGSIRLAPRHVWRLRVYVLRMLVHVIAVRVLGWRVLLSVLVRVRVTRMFQTIFQQATGWSSSVQGSWRRRRGFQSYIRMIS